MTVREAVTLADLTTLRVGGPAARLVEPDTELDIVRTATGVWNAGGDWWVLGGGSNVLVSDDGLDGTVLRIATRGLRRVDGERDDRIRIRIAAGEPWDAVVAVAIHNGWAGIEALSGIPGSTGAAPIQNIGAYGQELAQTLVAVDLLDYDSGHRVRVTADELGLGYRTSALKTGERRGVVIAVELDLVPAMDRAATALPIVYPQLADTLGIEVGGSASLPAVRAEVLRLRAGKGMVLDPADPDTASAGSFFTNPIVDENAARAMPADLPRWPVETEAPARVLPLGSEPGPVPRRPAPRVKLSAAGLIERAGIRRGFALPGSRAAISGKHTLAITNRGGATAAEIVQLAGFVQLRVMAEFGVRLQPEPVWLGDLDAG